MFSDRSMYHLPCCCLLRFKNIFCSCFFSLSVWWCQCMYCMVLHFSLLIFYVSIVSIIEYQLSLIMCLSEDLFLCMFISFISLYSMQICAIRGNTPHDRLYKRHLKFFFDALMIWLWFITSITRNILSSQNNIKTRYYTGSYLFFLNHSFAFCYFKIDLLTLRMTLNSTLIPEEDSPTKIKLHICAKIWPLNWPFDPEYKLESSYYYQK